MKAKLFFFITFCSIWSISIFSCDKKEKTPEPANSPTTPAPEVVQCILTHITTPSGDTIGYSAEYTDNKFTKLVNFWEPGVPTLLNTLTYSSSEINFKSYNRDGSLRSTSTILLNSKGLAIKETRIITEISDVMYDTVYFNYDSNGYKISEKSTSTSVHNSTGVKRIEKVEKEYSYLEGNLISITDKINNKITKFDYYSDKSNKSLLDEEGLPTFGMDFYGKPSRNLVRKVTYGSGESEEFNYVLDANGYVTRKTKTGGDDLSDIGYKYSCK